MLRLRFAGINLTVGWVLFFPPSLLPLRNLCRILKTINSQGNCFAFWSCVFETTNFQQETACKADVKAEEKPVKLTSATPCVVAVWLILLVFSADLRKFELNEFRASFQPWQAMNRIPFLAPSLILLAPVPRCQTIAAQMATTAKDLPANCS